MSGTDWAGIYSLLTLLVGAEGKHTARVWLYESTARLAEAAWLNSDDPHSGTIQSNKQKEPLLPEFMRHRPIKKPDAGAYPNREAGERKRLIGKETRGGLMGSKKNGTKNTWSGLGGASTGSTAASLAETRQLK